MKKKKKTAAHAAYSISIRQHNGDSFASADLRWECGWVQITGGCVNDYLGIAKRLGAAVQMQK